MEDREMKGARGWELIALVGVSAVGLLAGMSWWERSRPASQPLVAVYMRCVGMTPEEIIEPPMRGVPDFTGYRVVPQSEAYRLELIFRKRADAVTAMKDVQTAVVTVEPQLPEAVKRDGIHIRRLDRE